MRNHGFLRVGAASPRLKISDVPYNVAEIVKLIDAARKEGCSVLVFPELCITGYTCGDLFLQELLLEKALDGLETILEASRDGDILVVVGLPLQVKQSLYNCAAVILNGKILGIVPKTYIPDCNGFYEKRWFVSGFDVDVDSINLLNQTVPFGSLLFQCANDGMPFAMGVEIGADLFAAIPQSSYLALAGAMVIGNPAAFGETVGEVERRKESITQQSGRCALGYIHASAGVHESTTDSVFGGDCMIVENGEVLQRNEKFSRTSSLIITELDLERLNTVRLKKKDLFVKCCDVSDIMTVPFSFRVLPDITSLWRKIEQHPFTPEDPAQLDKVCAEVINIQVAGVAKRLEHIGCKNVTIGVSGGVDSTLALLVAVKTFDLLGIDRKNILAITMPGFATTQKTLDVSIGLINALAVTGREIDIKVACMQHFEDIGHDSSVYDETYENVQARERTQILMDLANKTGGIMIGTGDLSELALGWTTYNGDHMSMYSVNAGVPKTLIRAMLRWVAEDEKFAETREILLKIVDAPISPELVPGDKADDISQKTEDIIGPYELHDFFLYHIVGHSMSPSKVLFLAEHAFRNKYGVAEIRKWLSIFCRRFFSQQFKRSCMPDGPKVGLVDLSPRNGWRMPSDVASRIWMDDLMDDLE